jgi:DNA-binding IclR family transcriptional regulator
MRILHAFNVDTPELGVSELAAILGTHESTASRLASTLAAWGMLRKDPATGKYQLGIGLVTLAGMVAAHLDLRTVARPHLFRLRERTRETVTLACWDVDEAINIEQVPSLNAVAHAGPVGRRNPPHCTAAGKAILAYLPEERVAELAAKGLPRFTPKTICDQATLLRELERVRSQGYAVNTEE